MAPEARAESGRGIVLAEVAVQRGRRHRQGDGIDELRHALAQLRVGQAPSAPTDIVEHVVRLGGPDANCGDGRVAHDVLEEELRPCRGVELGGPGRKGRGA